MISYLGNISSSGSVKFQSSSFLRKLLHFIPAVSLLWLTACGHRNISGYYIQYDSLGIAYLQLTESDSQQLMGSLQFIRMLPTGQFERTDFNVNAGSVASDGSMLTLVVKENGFFTQPMNVSGVIKDNHVELSFPNGAFDLVRSSPEEFSSRLTTLSQDAAQVKAAKAHSELNSESLQENSALKRQFAAMSKMAEGDAQFIEQQRKKEQRLIGLAQADLEKLRLLKPDDSWGAGDIKYDLGNLSYQMGSIQYDNDSRINDLKNGIANLSDSISRNVCNKDASLQGCSELQEHESTLQTLNSIIQKDVAQLSDDFKKNQASLEALSKQSQH